MNGDTQFWVTTLVATCGATLATLSFILSVWLGIIEVNRLKSKVQMRPSQGCLYANGKASESFVPIDAVNTGRGSVVLTGVGWILSNRKKLYYTNCYNLNLPFQLDERRACRFSLPARLFRELDDKDRIVSAFFEDETGRLWKAKVTRKMRAIWESMNNPGWKIARNDGLKVWYTTD